MDWKKILTEILHKLKIIDKDFTGKLVINVSQGTVCDGTKESRLK